MIKPKLMVVFVGAITLPLIAIPQITAQPSKPSPILTQTPQPSPPLSPASTFKLSPEQETQLKKIDTLLQAQIQNVLTPRQWQELQALQASGTSKNVTLAKLKLSPAQITQLKEIEAIAQQRFLSILTPAQKQQLQKGQLSPSPTPPLPSSSPSSPPSSTPSKTSLATSPALAALNLTADQQAQVQQIDALVQAQVQNILKPDQWKQLQQLQSAGTAKATAFAQLNLSDQQKSQLQEVEALAQQRLLSILTDSQKKTLQQQKQP
jgi:Spy/CpxP family protein refolding chaperone